MRLYIGGVSGKPLTAPAKNVRKICGERLLVGLVLRQRDPGEV